MPEFSAAIFATSERLFGQEHGLIAQALLFEGSRPYWEIHIGGKKFLFIAHPDFILEDGTYIEIKNYKSELTESKINNFPSKIEVLYKEDLSYVFDYVINKYGKDYIQKYE